jgi:hypothetical protein
MRSALSATACASYDGHDMLANYFFIIRHAGKAYVMLEGQQLSC